MSGKEPTMATVVLPDAGTFVNHGLEAIMLFRLHCCVLSCIDIVLVGVYPGLGFNDDDLFEVVCANTGRPQAGNTKQPCQRMWREGGEVPAYLPPEITAVPRIFLRAWFDCSPSLGMSLIIVSFETRW